MAIESSILTAYENLGMLALGSFTVHVAGIRYGVPDADATGMSVSLDRVKRLIDRRGKHRFPLLEGQALEAIANAVVYSNKDDMEQRAALGRFFRLTEYDFRQRPRESDVIWAPDGDEAFDDWSQILWLDEPDGVRVIAFHCHDDSSGEWSPHQVRSVVMSADDAYSVLQRWWESFQAELARTPKVRWTEL